MAGEDRLEDEDEDEDEAQAEPKSVIGAHSEMLSHVTVISRG